ncbi:MAG TPA: 3'-5' exonuclease [Acidimicrobiales bacterium]|nr:3'-5' exonuclease [Acidimicrobiales bacterium]
MAVYGLDIETDTGAGGLDPARCRILAAAVAGDDGTTVLTGPEPRLLGALDEHVAGLGPAVLVTWNGSGFDLPFIAERARRCGVATGLRLRLDPGIVRSHPPLAGHEGSYRAAWHGAVHLDAYLAYRSLLAGTGLSCSLKAAARRAGLAVVDADASKVHELSAHQLVRYVASDAALAMALAVARWDRVRDFGDGPLPVRAPAPLLSRTG